MRTIWKYILNLKDDIIDIIMPKNAEILYVGNQDNYPCLWVLVETELEKENRKFRIYGTGHPILPNVNTPYNTYDIYVGTVITWNGKLVWHIFEVK